MVTNLEQLLKRFCLLRNEAVYISGRDHEVSDFAALLKNAGGLLETFLKKHVHPNGQRWNFERLINELALVGISAQEIDRLHLLRRRYNSAKHDPAYEATVDEVMEALNGAILVFEGLIGLGIGTTENKANPAYHRRVWLAAWDHYIHGDGEVHIILPVVEDDYDFPPTIDIVYLKGLAWPDVLHPLGVAVRSAQGLIPQKYLTMWQGEGDFAGARVFDGAYKDLLRILAAAELRLDLLSFLKRENDSMAMRTALAFASVDAASEHGAFGSIQEMKDEILKRGSRDYAAPQTAALAIRSADRFCNLLSNVPSSRLSEITGPRFLSTTRFNQALSQAIAIDDSAAITSGLELVIRL